MAAGTLAGVIPPLSTVTVQVTDLPPTVPDCVHWNARVLSEASVTALPR